MSLKALMTGTEGPLRQVVHRLLREHAGHQAVEPAVQVAGHVLEGLAHADGPFQKSGVAAKLFDGLLEGELGAQRRFFEKENDGFPCENLRVGGRRALHLGGEVQQQQDFVVGEIEVAQQVR